MSAKSLSYWLLVACSAVTANAMAGVCDAPFMHNGGSVTLTGTGNLKLGADLSFSDVSKTNATNCRVRVQGTASFSYAGFPPSQSKLDYLMTIKQGQASFVKYANAGERPSDEGQFDPRMLGLFAYDGGTLHVGQRMPGATYRLNIGKSAPIGGQPSTVVRIGEKIVGARQSLDTALGRQSCWPIRYTRDTDPTMATFKGLSLPIPGMNTTVTDWFCPQVDMVMRQDIDQGGQKSVVEITSIK